MAVECPICYNEFNTEDRTPFVGTCGHSVCGSCRLRLLRECPTCKTPSAFLEKRKNFQLIDSVTASQLEARRTASEYACHVCKSGVLLETALLCISCLKERKLNEGEMLKALLCKNCATAGLGHGHFIKKAQGTLILSKSVSLRDELKSIMRTEILANSGYICGARTTRVYEEWEQKVAKMGVFNADLAEFNEARDELREITRNVAQAYEDVIKRTKEVEQLILRASEKTSAFVDKTEPFTAFQRAVFHIKAAAPSTSTAPSSSRTISAATSITRVTGIPTTAKTTTVARRPLATLAIRRN